MRRHGCLIKKTPFLCLKKGEGINMKKIKVVIFCCHNCISDKDIDSLERHEAADIRLIKLPCSGRLEVLHILEAFETGSDGVIVLTCLNGKCQ